MSFPTFLKVLPAAFIAMGAVAVAASSANASPLAAHATTAVTADASAHADAWGVTKLRVGTKKRRHTVRRKSGRFSGFGFRGDGFRTSGKYN